MYTHDCRCEEGVDVKVAVCSTGGEGVEESPALDAYNSESGNNEVKTTFVSILK